MSTDLIAQLRDADTTYKRPAVPAVYAEYEAFIATGAYPYNDSVVAEIARRYGVGAESWSERQRFDHQAVHDLGEPLLIQLHHEVYLASGQHKVALMRQEEAALLANGFHPITELVPHIFMRVELPGGYVYRVVRDGRGGWALLAPRKRTHGVSLGRMVDQHRAYLDAVECNQTKHNAPAVKMYREVAS